MWENLKKGDIIKLPLTYSDLVQSKERPALVLYHDEELRQLTVAYITSKTSNLRPTDILIVFGLRPFWSSLLSRTPLWPWWSRLHRLNMGTVVSGMFVTSKIFPRISSMGPPIERSVMVSAPYFSAVVAFFISSLRSKTSAELPMLALIFVLRPSPMPIGYLSPLCIMTTRPEAICFIRILGCSHSALAAA